MAFKFSKFNKERLFDVDTSEFDYCSLEDLWKKNPNSETAYRLRGVYISTKSEFNDRSPMCAIDGYYVNLPQHQLGDIERMLEDRQAIKAINDGLAGFVIRPYDQKRFGKLCYAAKWVDMEVEDLDD